MLMFVTTAFAEVAGSIPVQQVQSVDLSQLDTIIGAVVGAAAVAVLGFILYRIGVVKFSMEKGPDNNALADLKVLIGELKEDIKKYAEEHRQCQIALPEKYVQWEIFNRLNTKLEEDREKKWDRFFAHTHDPSSGVVLIPRK